MGKSVDRLVEDFAQRVQVRGLPLRPADVKAFGNAALEFGPPSHFFRELVDSMRFIDQAEFSQTLDTLAKAFRSLVPRSYTFLDHHKKSSNSWIYAQLLKRGIHPAEKVVNMQDDDLTGDFFKPAKPGSTIVYADDFSFSGSQISEALNSYLLEQYTTFIFTGYTLPEAQKEIAKYNPRVFRFSPFTLESLPETLSLDSLEVISKMEDMVDPGRGERASIYGGDSLNWSYFKVSDTIPACLRGVVSTTMGSRGFPPLIRKLDFPEPYRK